MQIIYHLQLSYDKYKKRVFYVSIFKLKLNHFYENYILIYIYIYINHRVYLFNKGFNNI